MSTRSPLPRPIEFRLKAAAHWLGAALLAWAALWSVAVAPAHAGGLKVQPVRLELRPERASGLLTISNPSNEPMLVQAEAFAWRQVNGEDVLEPAPGVLLNPPIFELPPGGRQLVRVGFRSATPAAGESAWRIWLSQVPEGAPRPEMGEELPQGVRMLFRVSLPLFVTPPGAARAAPEWRLEQGELTLANRGARHLQLHDLVFRRDDGARLAQDMRYVLPGATARWSLPPDWRGRALTVEAGSNVGAIRQRVEAATR